MNSFDRLVRIGWMILVVVMLDGPSALAGDALPTDDRAAQPAPRSQRVPFAVTALAVSPDGRNVLTGSQHGITVRSWPQFQELRDLATDLVHIHDLCFSPDGRRLLVSGGDPARHGGVEIVAWPDGGRLAQVTSHDDVVYRGDWSPDGLRCATASGDGTCHILDASTAARLVRYDGHSRAVLAVRYLPDGGTVVSAGVDQTLRVWTDEGVHLRTLDHHTAAVTGIAVRPSHDHSGPVMVATISDDRTVRLWQPTIGRLVRFVRLTSVPKAVAWSARGDRFMVGCVDGRIRVIDPDTIAVAGDLDGLDDRIQEVAMHPISGQMVVAGGSIRSVSFDDRVGNETAP